MYLYIYFLNCFKYEIILFFYQKLLAHSVHFIASFRVITSILSRGCGSQTLKFRCAFLVKCGWECDCATAREEEARARPWSSSASFRQLGSTSVGTRQSAAAAAKPTRGYGCAPDYDRATTTLYSCLLSYSFAVCRSNGTDADADAAKEEKRERRGTDGSA